ncbi:MAG: hypothetical protein ACOVOD_01420, partial [Rhodoferax sp.]
EALLRSTSELITAPTEDLQKRAEAVALWRSLNLTPEDVLRESARIQGLEKDVQDLKAVSLSLQTQTQDLLSRLEKSEQLRYKNPLVYGLALLLLAALGFAGFAWRKRREGATAPWWGSNAADSVASPVEMATGSMTAPDMDSARSVEPVVAPATSAGLAPVAFDGNVDIDLQLDEAPLSPKIEASNKAIDKLSTINIPGGLLPKIVNSRDFSPSMSGTLRSINTKEMLDVRQQAEFFMTLGQYDDAISMLSGSIDSSDQSNPLVYLDLLKVYHTLSRKSEFDALREEFNQIFTGHVPPYATFAQGGKGLEHLPSLCSAIADLWPRQAAIDLIEKALVRGVDNEPGRELDLEAFRDLLLLHAIASRQLAETDSGWVPFSAMRVVAAPAPGASSGWAAEAAQASEPLPLIPSLAPDAALGAVDLDLDLDLDLSEPKDNLIEFDASILSQPAPDKSN